MPHLNDKQWEQLGNTPNVDAAYFREDLLREFNEHYERIGQDSDALWVAAHALIRFNRGTGEVDNIFRTSPASRNAVEALSAKLAVAAGTGDITEAQTPFKYGAFNLALVVPLPAREHPATLSVITLDYDASKAVQGKHIQDSEWLGGNFIEERLEAIRVARESVGASLVEAGPYWLGAFGQLVDSYHQVFEADPEAQAATIEVEPWVSQPITSN